MRFAIQLPQTTDRRLLERLACQGVVRQTRHPELPLEMWDHSSSACFLNAGQWQQEPNFAGCLVLDCEGRVVARGYPKLQDGPARLGVEGGPYSVSEKMDGHPVIVFLWQDRLVVASRGSFTGWQSARARRILEQQYSCWRPARGFTYLFELTSPEKPVVIRHAEEKLWLLDVIGPDGWPDQKAAAELCFFPQTPRRICREAVLDVDSNMVSEGWVVRSLTTGLMWKVRLRRYVDCRRILFSPLRELAMFWAEKGYAAVMAEIRRLAGIRDEVFTWLCQQALDWEAQASLLARRIDEACAWLRRKHGANRKAYAEAVDSEPYLKPWVWAMSDRFEGKPVEPGLRKAIADRQPVQTVVELASEVHESE